MKTIKNGDSGALVSALQMRLTVLGYTAGAVDGAFGPMTETAVRSFQARAKLTVDGVVGPKTAEALARAAMVVPGAEAPPAPVAPSSAFVDGYYSGARRCLMHKGRIGGMIVGKGVVVHTTDTLDGMGAMTKAWATTPGKGQGAHYMLGRRAPTAAELLNEEYPTNGLAQLCPIDRNSNHAGGPSHGNVIVPGEKRPLHPNSHYLGVEIVAGGRLQKTGSRYVHQGSGRVVSDEDVYLDERGRPWHRITEYQFVQLATLLDALDAVMPRLPDGAIVKSNGSYTQNGVSWAVMPGVRFVGHVTLDPMRKTDPGPEGIAWLHERYGDRG